MLTREDLAAIGAMMDEKLETRLKPIRQDITGIKGEIAEMKGEITEIKDEITGMKGEITGMKGEITGMKSDIKEMKGEILTLKERTTKLELTMEHQVDRAVNLVLEGHEGLRQMIEGRLVTKDEREQDRVRIFALEEIAKLHTSQIADLQKKTS